MAWSKPGDSAFLKSHNAEHRGGPRPTTGPFPPPFSSCPRPARTFLSSGCFFPGPVRGLLVETVGAGSAEEEHVQEASTGRPRHHSFPSGHRRELPHRPPEEPLPTMGYVIDVPQQRSLCGSCFHPLSVSREATQTLRYGGRMLTNGLTAEHSFFLWSSSYTVKAALSLGPAEQCPLPRRCSLHHPMGLGRRILGGPRPVLVLGDPSRRGSQRMWPAFSPPPTGCRLISQIAERELQYLLELARNTYSWPHPRPTNQKL